MKKSLSGHEPFTSKAAGWLDVTWKTGFRLSRN